MLTPEQLLVISKKASLVYGDFELILIEEMAERIALTGLANMVVYNYAEIAQEMGMLYSDIIKKVAEYSEKSEEEIRLIFQDAGIKSLSFDDKIYKEAGFGVNGLSPRMIQLLSATAKNTNNNIYNLTKTTAVNSQSQFYKNINQAYIEVSTGLKSNSQAIIDAIKNTSKEGAIVSYPSGYKTSIENALRMNITTSVSQVCGKLQEMRADELGWDLMEVTAHAGSRPEHSEWQGKIVSRSGQKGYLSLNDIGYGEVTGFKGVNCRHDWYPYYKGSTRTYTKKMLDEYNNAKVKYNGNEIDLYSATQLQRQYERTIRNYKKELVGLTASINASSNKDFIENAQIEFKKIDSKKREYTQKYNDFLQQTGLQKDGSRLQIVK